MKSILVYLIVFTAWATVEAQPLPQAEEYQRQQQFLQHQQTLQQMRDAPRPGASVPGTTKTLNSSLVEDDEIVGLCRLKSGCNGGTALLSTQDGRSLQSARIDSKKTFRFTKLNAQATYRIEVISFDGSARGEALGVRSGHTVEVPD